MSQLLGYIPPVMPPSMPLPHLPGQLSFTGQLLGSASAHTGSGNSRTPVLVYTAKLEKQPAANSSSSSGPTAGDDEVVVKIPGNDRLFNKEVSTIVIQVYLSLRLASLAAHTACKLGNFIQGASSPAWLTWTDSWSSMKDAAGACTHGTLE